MRKAWLDRTAVIVVALAALGGCAAGLDPRGVSENMQSVGAERGSDRAMAALSRGDFANAERYALAALRQNPKDPYALLVAGQAYQGTGRYDIARQYYEVIVTNQPAATVLVPGEGGQMLPRNVVDIARTNLAALDRLAGRTVPRGMAQSGRPPGASAIGAPPFPSIEPAPAAPRVDAVVFELAPPAGPDGMAVGVPGRASDAEANLAGRFRILKRLLDDGLITPEEYSSRRNANLGALLPYSAPPPAQGLDRPIPRDEEIVARIRALGTALEARELDPREHAAERGIILDALLPASPRRVDLPALAPKDMIEAGASVGRLERMRSAGLVSAEESKRERAAVEKLLDTRLASARVVGEGTGLSRGLPQPGVATGPGGWGLNLGTAKTEAAAKKLWAGILKKFPEQLGSLEPQFRKVAVTGKGTRWRIVAGPVAGKDQAVAQCKALKLHRQACDPAELQP